MRILWLRPDKPANVSVGRHRLAGILTERGHEVTVRNVSLGNAWSGVTDPADVVVGTTRLGAMVGASRKLLRGTPLVVDHIDPIEQFRRSNGRVPTAVVGGLEAASFRLADHVMVVYETERPRVERHASAVTQTRLGVDVDLFADPTADAIECAREVLDESGLAVDETGSSDRQLLLYVGGLEPAYNVRLLVDAMAHLPDWDLLVLGDGSQREVVTSASGGNVHYLGTVPHEQVPGFTHVSDVGVSLVDDRNTLKVLEYGAAGLPTVALEGDAEVRFGDSLTYCRTDAEDVARAVEDAVRRGPSESLAELARRHDWNTIADEYEAVLESVV